MTSIEQPTKQKLSHDDVETHIPSNDLLTPAKDIGDDDDDGVHEIIDDWGLGEQEGNDNFQLFARHEQHTIYIPLYSNNITTTTTKTTIDDENVIPKETVDDDKDQTTGGSPTFIQYFIKCVESLTPIDMINMSNGIHDSTGHCVWTGSFLFISALTKKLQQEYFQSKIVLELGCGTGISSLSLLKLDIPTKIVLTDGDPESIKLSKENIDLLHVDTNETKTVQKLNYQVLPLLWGNEGDMDHVLALNPTGFDTVFATDVIYDIGLLPSLLQTSKRCLMGVSNSSNNIILNNSINNRNDDRYFILSHVPRACYNSENPPPQEKSLEEYIIDHAYQYNFHLLHIVRPLDIVSNCLIYDKNSINFPSDALNNTSLEEMQDIGASILIFKLLK